MTSFVDRLALSAAVDAASIAVTGGTMPLLNNLHFSPAAGNRLAIWGSDFDLEISANIEMQGEAIAYLNADAKKVKGLLAKAPKASLVRLDKDGEKTKFGFGAANYSLAGIEIEDEKGNPETADAMAVCGPVSNLFTIPGDVLKQALERVAPAISTEETRYYLNGVYFHDRGADLALIATDGARLHRQVIEKPDGYPVVTAGGDGKDDEGTILPGVIVPHVTVKAMLKLLGKRPPAEIDMRLDATRIEFSFPFEFGVITVRSKLVDGTFPDYPRVIPLHNPLVVTVDKATLVEAIKATAIILAKTDRGMKFTFSPNGNHLFARNRDDGSTANFPLDLISGLDKEFEIGLHWGYFLESLACFDTPISIAFNEDGGPAVSTSYSQPGFTAIQMPMKVA